MADKKITPIKESLKYCFRQIWQYKKSFIPLSVLNVLAGAAIPFAEIIFLPLLINSLTAEEKNLKLILFYGGAMVISQIILTAFNSVLSIQLEKTGDLFINAASEEISQRCMSIDFSLTEDKQALNQIQKARDGIDFSGGAYAIANAFFTIISNVIKLLGVMTVMLFTAPLLLIIIIVLLVASTVVNAKKSNIDIKEFANLSETDRIFWYILREIENYRYGKDIRLYGAAGMMLNQAVTQINWLADYYKRINDKKYPLNILDIIINVLRDFGTYFYLGVLAVTGKITIGVFSQLLIAGGTLYISLYAIITGLQDIVKRSGYIYEIIKFMDYPPAMEKGIRKISDLGGKHEIEFRNVSFRYPGTDKDVLHDVSIKLKSGEKLSVVGLNGAGKTTFVKLMCRLYDVTSGEILLDGVNIREYDYDEYMKCFSVVFQDFMLLAFTAEDNILLGKEDSSERVDEIFKKVGLLDKINSLPNGKDTVMFKHFDDAGVDLSGGEQQKMAIARALYKGSPVVILDEPTAALDPVAEYEIYRQFNDLVHGKTAIYISHRLSSCKFCDRIAVFSDGTIKETGTHEELVHLNNGIYAEMFKAQAQYYV